MYMHLIFYTHLKWHQNVPCPWNPGFEPGVVPLFRRHINSIGIPIIEIRWSHNRFIHIMEISYLKRRSSWWNGALGFYQPFQEIMSHKGKKNGNIGHHQISFYISIMKLYGVYHTALNCFLTNVEKQKGYAMLKWVRISRYRRLNDQSIHIN